jgi:hypothetical protein
MHIIVFKEAHHCCRESSRAKCGLDGLWDLNRVQILQPQLNQSRKAEPDVLSGSTAGQMVSWPFR